MAKSSPKSGRSTGKTKKGKSGRQARRPVRRAAARMRVPEPPPFKEAMARVYAAPDVLPSLMATFAGYDGPEVSGGPGPLVGHAQRPAR